MKGCSSTHHKFGSSSKSSLCLPLLLYKFHLERSQSTMVALQTLNSQPYFYSSSWYS